MDYLLDTTILIDLLRQKKDVWNFIADHSKDKFMTSAICEAEVWEGVYREKEANFDKKKKVLEDLLASLFQIVPFDSKQAKISGQIRASLSIKGDLPGDIDVLIGAATMANDAILLTKNVKHFSRIPGLEVLYFDSLASK